MAIKSVVYTVRIPLPHSKQITMLAAREFEKPVTVLRRLVRRGLEAEAGAVQDEHKAA